MAMKLCRNCRSELTRTFVDLGHTPLANSYLTHEQLDEPETWYPLHAYVCENCLMVQLPEVATPQQIFTHYDYWSSTSPTWVEHHRKYADEMTDKLGLDEKSLVVEIGSNDGYLLQHFNTNGIPVCGYEPASNIAAHANERGITTVNDFFGTRSVNGLAKSADLICGTNVLAHVPDLHDVVEAIRIVLKSTGTCTMEFPWLLHLIQQNQFDTIYHEHYSYFSFKVVESVFAQHGLIITHVDFLDTHGGSIRIHARHGECAVPDDTVHKALMLEHAVGLHELDGYSGFGKKCWKAKTNLIGMINFAGEWAACGAPAKGNTLLNYCGIDRELIDFTVDDSPHKQGKYLPGSHIPIVTREHLLKAKPDYVLLLAWNLAEPIIKANPEVRQWGGQWIVPIPEPKVVE